ncbi:MAG: S8 family peptidase [Myxococcaceae bacterium]|nr:S8 family peptidase [Myxococcaceae bacterium]
MRRLLILGLLLLTACPKEEKEEEVPVTTGLIQGKLNPFKGAGQSAEPTVARPPLLQGESAEAVSRAISRALARQQQQRLEVGRSSLEVSQPLARLPATELTIPGEVIVRFERAGLSAALAVEELKVPGYRVVHKGYASEHLHLLGFEPLDGRGLTVAETGQLAAQVAELPGVRFAENNLRMYPFRTPNDRNYPGQWHYPAINLPAAWEVSVGAAAVTVAVLDSGIGVHPDLTPRIVGGYDMISDAASAGDGDGRDGDPTDMGKDEPGGGSSWHGTHVAGTLGAATDNADGVAGVTWAARIVPVRVLGRAGASMFDVVAAMSWAAGGSVPGLPPNPHPARVVNMSLGGAAPPQQAYQDVIDERLAAAGTLFVMAAGNENTNAANITPCNQQNVLCVGATNFAGRRSSYSNFGAPVDVMAAGGEMTEDLNGDKHPDGVLSTWFDASGQPAYTIKQGTSFAAPHVAGVVALMLAVDPSLSLAQVENILTLTASASSQCPEGCGAGLVNAQAALKKVAGGSEGDPPRLGVTTSLLSFRGGGEAQRLLLSNLGAGTLRVTVAKSGPQASAVSLPTDTVSVPAFGTKPLVVEVNTAGLADGEYSATLALTGTNEDTGAEAGTATVAVRIRVGVAADRDAVILFAWQDELKAWHIEEEAAAVVTVASGYQYSIQLPPRTYYTVAGIDDDADGKFFEDGERTGFWRNVDDFEPIPLEVGQTVSGINFDLVPLATIDDTPALVVGSACSSNAECPDGGQCELGYPGGYCTRECATQPCPAGSKCYVVNSSTGAKACLASCSAPGQGRSDCRADYVCYDDRAGAGECLPSCGVLNICGGATPTCAASGYCQ